LAKTPPAPLENTLFGNRSGSWSWLPPIDAQLHDIPCGAAVAQGTIMHDAQGKGSISCSLSGRGAYRIRIHAADEGGGDVVQDKIIVVSGNAHEAVPIMAPSVTLVEKNEYRAGEKARCIIGSALADGTYVLEIWAGEYCVSQQLITGNLPVRMIEIPITEMMKGGFSIRWFG